MYLKKILLALVLLGVLAGFGFVYFVYTNIFSPNTAFSNEEAYVYIPSGATYAEVKEQLNPLLKNIESFDRVARRKGYTTNVKAGKYRIKKDMNNNDLINAIRSNNIPVQLSFNNQETLADLAGRISKQIEADSTELIKVMSEENFLKNQGFDQRNALAMYLPNTYEFFWNTDAEGFRDRMLKEFRRFWNESRLAKAEAQNLTPLQVITLASIVQKETAKTDERARVAGVYLNRLQKGIPLQADPTVIYALKEQAGDFNLVIKRVLLRDLETDSPYNTYKYGGLPPGPIAMPDISSIEAVLNPEEHDFYYFVADIHNFGYHKFARTLTEHNRNAREYQQWIQAQGVNR